MGLTTLPPSCADCLEIWEPHPLEPLGSVHGFIGIALPSGITQSVKRLGTGWTVRGSNPDGARFSVPVQTVPGAHSAPYTMGTGSLPGVKQLGCGVDHPPPPGAEVKERIELYLYSVSGPS